MLENQLVILLTWNKEKAAHFVDEIDTIKQF